MDFIERWFGISPDAGSGAFELLILAALLLMITVVWFRRPLLQICSWLRTKVRPGLHR
jgi:hypothetical protein